MAVGQEVFSKELLRLLFVENEIGKAICDFEIPKCDAERAWEQGVDLGEEEEE